jgi:hypothetical protein
MMGNKKSPDGFAVPGIFFASQAHQVMFRDCALQQRKSSI